MASQETQGKARRGPRLSGARELELPPTYNHDGRTYTAGFEMRPRSHTVAVEASRRPLNLPSSPGRQPVVATIKPRSQTHYPSPSRDGGERYIFPSSSHARHRQKPAGGVGGDTDTLLSPGDRETKYRNGYLTPASSSNAGYPSPGKDIDVHDSFSYTNAREQFYRDSDAIRESRRQAPPVRKSRPLSLTGLEAYLPQITREPKASGPPPSSRGFAGTEKEDGPRSYKEIKPRAADTNNAPISIPRTANSPRRSSTHRTPVSLHQEKKPSSPVPRRSGYDDVRDKGYQIRRDANNIVVVDDKLELPRRDPRRSISGQPPTRERGYSNPRAPEGMMSGGLATAGLASGYSKEPIEITPRSDARNGRDRLDIPSRAEERYRPAPKHWSQGADDGYHSDGDREKYRYKPSPPREPERRPRDLSPVDSDSKRSGLSPRHDNFVEITPRDPNTTPSKRSPPPQPSGTSPESQTPKGILKQPTQKFPEEPRAVREGVAPLKDAPKKGVPTGARWTKIDRRLVSPSALEGRERFEERPDYVIVLRVLSREEIEQYAVASAKIRAAARNRRNSDRRSRDEDDIRSRRRDIDSDDDEDRESQLRIEPPPKDPRR
ncbi:uncharacterized protein GIQ15_06711 [Arthroderma uncinatum]|uniref:uncharacterized protein n=1 Tax=Arthroderma uncinatum TaxID=74035 RepID=UPI00144AAE76|nr:uncharacterized protein GIQ15_06711 [Arthroderma uncinatum]KAF3479735.1 hypothetical protein GIQ15_06711 [Arthroderma uncinatum]